MTKCPLCHLDEYAQEVINDKKEPDKLALIPYICDGHLCESIYAVLAYIKDGVVSRQSMMFNYSMNDHKNLLKLEIKELQSRVEIVIGEATSHL